MANSQRAVSILILLELPFDLCHDLLIAALFVSFNPYFIGIAV
mgnify:CR=1 FL=1